MKKKKRKTQKTSVIILVILIVSTVLAAALYYVFGSNIHFRNVASIHKEARRYETKECLAFYPDNSEKIEAYIKDLCSKAPKNSIFDYAEAEYGDYRRIDYGFGNSFYIDQNGQDLRVDKVSEEGRRIISSYVRYQLKKEEVDLAYTSAFMDETAPESIDPGALDYTIAGEDLAVYFPKYFETIRIPLKYMQKEIGIDLGYENETFTRMHYVSKNRPAICFTFDDGPNISTKDPTSQYMVDQLAHYDSSATFFLVGTSIGNRQLEFLEDAVAKGMEYGSHTFHHVYLTKLDSESEIREEITFPAYCLKDAFGYDMRLYRPPYGSHNSFVDQCSPFAGILWNVDSLDWKVRIGNEHDTAVSLIKENVISQANDNDVVLFHDIYRTSVDAASELIPFYLDRGYQIVNVSELMELLGIENARTFGGR